MPKKFKYDNTDVLGIITLQRGAFNNNSINVRIHKDMAKYFNTGFVVFDIVKMSIREATIADNKPSKLTTTKCGTHSFTVTYSNREEYLGEYEVEESQDEKQIYKLYKID